MDFGLWIRGGISIALLIPTALLAQKIQPQIDVPVGLSGGEREALEHSASASLFGQFRTNAADFLWLKVDNYTHGGVDLRAMTEEEKRRLHGGLVTSDEGKGTGNRGHDGTEVGVVPDRERDWRGVFGDVERQTQPYMELKNHKHRDPKEALPLFRLMTLANPKFVTGYVTGAYALAWQKKIDGALTFLREGERNNPESGAIQYTLGELYIRLGHEAHTRSLKAREQGRTADIAPAEAERDSLYNTATPYLKKAIALIAAHKPESRSEDDTEAYGPAYRLLIILNRDRGDQIEARRLATECLALFPDDPTANTYLRQHPTP